MTDKTPTSRRNFLKGSLAAGGALAATPALAKASIVSERSAV